MGAKTWMISYSDGDVSETLKQSSELNREKTIELASSLFPNNRLELIGEGDLSFTNPPKDEVLAGYFSGVLIVATDELAIDYPSNIPQRFISNGLGSKIQLHAMHSVVDWFAYAIWENEDLVRALSLSPDSGLLEDLGEKLPVELPFWNGKHPVYDPEDGEDEDAYPFNFHPLELGEALLNYLYGYVIEGVVDDNQIEPEEFVLLRFKRLPTKPWWRFW